MSRVAFVTLGCDKNTVDSERHLASLTAHGAAITADLADADVIVVNTCGFIDAAKQESIDAVVNAARLKHAGSCSTLVTIGCMVERHRDELTTALPEVDLFLGTSDADQLVPQLIDRGLLRPEALVHPGERVYSGELPHVRYLKVSEGCDHGCAFCAIPLMRGKHRSFALDDVVREAQLLEAQGAREVNLVAQDLAHYGRDRRDGTGLPELLEALVRETSIPWFRNLYLYSAGITPRLLDVVAGEPRIVPYLDMPIQHASDEMLLAMRRPERKRTIRDKVARFRDAVPGVAIRTTVIVGFPGETDAQVDELAEFLEEMRFERVGVFTYSPQEGTRAAKLRDDVPDSLKRERHERITELQRVITAEKYEDRVGSRTRVLVDTDRSERAPATGRLPWQADDIDGMTRLDGGAVPGAFVDVIVTDVVDDYDFTARIVGTEAPREPVARRRALPVMPGRSTAGSFGR